MYRMGQSKKSSSGCFCRRAFFLAILLVLGSGSVCIGQKPQKLEKNYREWLERDVIYLINKEERDAFRRLATNEARDKFIEDFWEIRNPNRRCSVQHRLRHGRLAHGPRAHLHHLGSASTKTGFPEFRESLPYRDLVLRRREPRSSHVFLCDVLPAGRQRRLSLLQSVYRRPR